MKVNSISIAKSLIAVLLVVGMIAASILAFFTVSEAQADPTVELVGYDVWAWGQSSFGQLGTGPRTFDANPIFPGNAASRGYDAWVPELVSKLSEIHEDYGIERMYSWLEGTLAITECSQIFTWGRNDWGQLGNGTFTYPHDPHQEPTLNQILTDLYEYHDGIQIFHTGQHHAVVTMGDGTVLSWGRNNWGQLGNGLAGIPGAGGSEVHNSNVPVEISVLTARNQNPSTRIVELHGGSNYTFALLANGDVYAWGHQHGGRLANGHALTDNTSPANNNPTPTRNATLSAMNISEFHNAGHHSLIVTTAGRVYVWGENGGNLSAASVCTRQGRLGLGPDFANIPAAANILVNSANTPTYNPYVTALYQNYADVRIYVAYTMNILIGADNSGVMHAYAWGNNTSGNLGNNQMGVHALAPVAVPQIAALAERGMTRAVMNQHVESYVFMVGEGGSDRYLYVWGLGTFGRHGVNGNLNAAGNLVPPHTHVNAPFPIPSVPNRVGDQSASELLRGGAQFFVGGRNIFAFDPVEQIVFNLTKTLELNEGTAIPSPDLSFAFNFARVQVPINDASPPRLSRPIAEVPNITNQTITVDSATATTAGGVISITGELNLWALIQDVLDAANVSGGVFVWEVTEVANSSNVNASAAPNMVVYDESRFQIRAHVNRYGDLRIVELIEMEQVSGNWQVRLPKLEDGIEFVNTYTRRVGNNERAALYINKYVDERDMADLSTRFSFTITLTNPVIIPPAIGSVTATVLNATTELPVSPARTYPIGAGTSNFTLAHNEKLRIPELPAGTRFQITENARPRFIPEATILGSTPVPPATGTYPQQDVGDPLPTGTYIIHQTNLNRANFINTYVWDVPTGLFITSTPWIALGAVALLLALLVTARNRKRIEEIPLVL